MQDGNWRHLGVPMRLFARVGSIWIRYKNGYRQFFDKHLRRWVFTHRRAVENAQGPIPAGHEVHHVDGDKTNNRPENLQVLTKQEHQAIHRGQDGSSPRRASPVKPKKSTAIARPKTKPLTTKSVPRVTAPVAPPKATAPLVAPVPMAQNALSPAAMALLTVMIQARMGGFGGGSCSRCGGTGYLPEYSHVAGGVCFACGGGGGYDNSRDYDDYRWDSDWFDDRY